MHATGLFFALIRSSVLLTFADAPLLSQSFQSFARAFALLAQSMFYSVSI
jgi:hypothetical protein